MSFASKIVVFAVALLAVSGCAASGGTADGGTRAVRTPAVKDGLAALDPCQVFTEADLAGTGVTLQGEPDSLVDYEPGCNYGGPEMDVSLYKNSTATFAEYVEQSNLASRTPVEINGRQAVNAVTAGSEGQGICSTIVDAGGGVVLVTVTGTLADSVPDPCGQAQEIATRIEPRLPE